MKLLNVSIYTSTSLTDRMNLYATNEEITDEKDKKLRELLAATANAIPKAKEPVIISCTISEYGSDVIFAHYSYYPEKDEDVVTAGMDIRNSVKVWEVGATVRKEEKNDD